MLAKIETPCVAGVFVDPTLRILAQETGRARGRHHVLVVATEGSDHVHG